MTKIVMIFIVLIVMIVLILLIFVQILLSETNLNSDPQFSPLESGFELLKYNSSMSSSFFFLAVLFVFFDLEVVLVLSSVTFLLKPAFLVLKFTTLFMFICLSLAIEWKMSGLKWSS